MVRSLLALCLLGLATACAAPTAATPAAVSTPSAAPATPPASAAPLEAGTPVAASPAVATPAPGALPKITYSQCHIADGQYIAMTFDDGPHATNTPRLLDILKQRGIKATFFMVGQCVAEYPEIVKRIVAEGHEIGNHSWSHPQLSTMSEAGVRQEIQKTHDVITQAAGVAPTLLRPPYGAFTQRQQRWANSVWGYKIILWDVDPLDWKVRNAEHVKSEILKQAVNGSIVLSHDIHATTVDAMAETLDALAAKGYKFVTVSELIAMDKAVPPKPKATPAAAAPKAAKATPAPKANAAGANRKPAA